MKVIHHFSPYLMTQPLIQSQLALEIYQLVSMAEEKDRLKTKKREMIKICALSDAFTQMSI